MHFTTPTSDNIKSGVKNLDLNKLMQNVGAEQFDFETFKTAYDTDPRIKEMIKNFDKTGIEPKTKVEMQSDSPVSQASGGDTVSAMAKSATDLSDL